MQRRKQSVLVRDMDSCVLCGSPNVEMHHALHGYGRRKLADRFGLIIPLCRKHHMRLHDFGEHDREFQQWAQEWYEEHMGTRKDFIREFGKSYL